MISVHEYKARLLEELLRLAPGSPEESGAHRAERPHTLTFTHPPRPEMGDLALAAFPLAKSLRRSPAEVARTWAESLRAEIGREGSPLQTLEVPLLRVEAEGPYLNLTLDPGALARLVLADVTTAGESYGRAPTLTGHTAMVEYSSPNTNKPLHLGHVRNNLIGMSLANILEAAGNRVIRVNLVNDRGIHICKSMLAYQRWGGAETPAATGEKGDHFVGRYYVLFNTKLQEERERFAQQKESAPPPSSQGDLPPAEEESRGRGDTGSRLEEAFLASSELMADAADLLRRWEAGDAEVLDLWRRMNGWVYEGFRATYARLGCRFDRWYFESDTWQLGKREVERGLELGVFYRAPDGSVWARLEPVGLKDKVLLRSDGTSVYITQDLGTAIRKFEDYRMDRSIYVVGSEQVAHFKNLFAILKLLGHPWAEHCHHASYGLVTLPHGMGRLKSREGTAVDADDLLDELRRLALDKIREGGYCETPETEEVAAEEIGQGALKLYILQVSSEKNIQFDPAETIAFTGDTGPAVQYSHARIHGILRKGLAEGKLAESELQTAGSTAGAGPFLRADCYDPNLLREPEEHEVLRLLGEFPEMVTLAARQLSAAPVANHLLELTKAYARMYHQHEVLRAASPELLRARLQLALGVAQTLRNGLALLTIEAPERM